MKSGDLTTGATKLHKSWKKLHDHWEQTKESWHDSVSRDFEENTLLKLEPQVASTLERMRTLAGVLNAAEHECDR